jgi:hypothetical protein
MTNPCCIASRQNPAYALGCHECGASCCATCVVHLESVTYCASCARGLLDTAHVRSTGPFRLF